MLALILEVASPSYGALLTGAFAAFWVAMSSIIQR